MADSPELRRSMGLVQTTALVVGIMVGAAVFVQAAEVSRWAARPAAMLTVWLVAGLLTLMGTLVCAELEQSFPATGGVYVFLHRTVSPLAGYLWGWAMFWAMHSGIVAAIAVVAARYCGLVAPLSGPMIRVVAIGLIVGLSGLNVLGIAPAARAQVALTVTKLAAIAGLVAAVGWWAAHHAPPPAPAAAAAWPGPGAFLLAVSAGLFAFGGWHMGTYAAGETRAAQRTIPRAMVAGTLVVTACYLGLNAAYIRILPWSQVASSTRVAADAAAVLLGGGGAALVSGLVVLSALGSLNGVILAGPRVYLAMARDRLAPAALAEVHPRFQTPHRAILLQALWSCLLVAVGTYRELFTGVVYLEWIFFGLMAWGLLRHRRRFGWAPVLFLAGCALVVGNLAVAEPRAALGVAGFVLTGVPAYYWQIRKTGSPTPYAAHP
ncbi:MAG TPA: amino acid permease [Terriglobales bacterium]|nr:amino acid permease [Terriglobales bacterium]